MGGWRYGRGHSLHGIVAPPHTGCEGTGGLTGGVHCLTGEQGGRGTQQLNAPEGPYPGPPALAPDPIEALDVTHCLRAAARPRRRTEALGVDCGGAAPRTRSPAPYRTHPVQVTVGMAAVPAPATPPLGRPQDPDPRPGTRVSLRPQPTRAPRDEAMALGPL